jgi:hypothetical protein
MNHRLVATLGSMVTLSILAADCASLKPAAEPTTPDPTSGSPRDRTVFGGLHHEPIQSRAADLLTLRTLLAEHHRLTTSEVVEYQSQAYRLEQNESARLDTRRLRKVWERLRSLGIDQLVDRS